MERVDWEGIAGMRGEGRGESSHGEGRGEEDWATLAGMSTCGT